MTEGCYQTVSGEFAELRAYLHAAAMRDPYIDLGEYYQESKWKHTMARVGGISIEYINP